VISLDEAGTASGRLYEDSGDGFTHLEGDYLDSTYEAKLVGGSLRLQIAAQEGMRPRPSRDLLVEVLTDRGVLRGHGRDGEPVELLMGSGSPR
jgi:alpha-glucosidase